MNNRRKTHKSRSRSRKTHKKNIRMRRKTKSIKTRTSRRMRRTYLKGGQGLVNRVNQGLVKHSQGLLKQSQGLVKQSQGLVNRVSQGLDNIKTKVPELGRRLSDKLSNNSMFKPRTLLKNTNKSTPTEGQGQFIDYYNQNSPRVLDVNPYDIRDKQIKKIQGWRGKK
jgi:hypothetical protein